MVSHEKACATGGSQRRRRSRYREMFFAINGVGPYNCFFDCGEAVSFDEVVVHHINGDHTNNDIHNLAPSHRICHNSHHFKELWANRKDELLLSSTRGNHKPHSEEAKLKMSEAQKKSGHAPTREAREKARLTNLGKPRSEETKRKISEAHKARRALRAQEVMPNEE